jgi:hypothetical protein
MSVFVYLNLVAFFFRSGKIISRLTNFQAFSEVAVGLRQIIEFFRLRIVRFRFFANYAMLGKLRR